jgi:hypothetical protein
VQPGEIAGRNGCSARRGRNGARADRRIMTMRELAGGEQDELGDDETQSQAATAGSVPRTTGTYHLHLLMLLGAHYTIPSRTPATSSVFRSLHSFPNTHDNLIIVHTSSRL